MIYKGLNRTGEIESVKAHGGGDVAEVYGGINEANPIYYKTITLTGTLPLSYKALGKPLSDYLISGNTLQNGTPTPEAPVDVVGCGVRTGNLCSNVAYKPNYYINEQGIEIANNRFNIYSVFCNSNTTYTILLKSPLIGTTFRIHAYNNGVWISQTATASIQDMPLTFTTPNNADEIRVSIANGANGNIMLNLGSSPLPYEPYGYKIPLTIGGTEYPIYLGNVQTTRRIKKLVLTGEETTWLRTSSEGRSIFYNTSITPDYLRSSDVTLLCTHYVAMANVERAVEVEEGKCALFKLIGANQRLYIVDSDFRSVDAFKSYLAAQYANGTPVTVWYVLAEPETAVVNEPLHKIGDYADTISMAQAGMTIPTVAGANTLTIDTAVQPSVVSITGNIKEVQGT